MRFSVDSNILFYAVDRQSPEKREVARDIINRGRLLDMILTSQVLAEFLNVVRRKNPDVLEEATELAADWSLLFPVAWTGPDHVTNGARLAIRHKLQLWDSIILEVARDARVSTLITEDMQDGATFNGVTLLNPFKSRNDKRLRDLLTG